MSFTEEAQTVRGNGSTPAQPTRLKIIAAIEDPPVIARLLAHLSFPTRLHRARPRHREGDNAPRRSVPSALSLHQDPIRPVRRLR